MRDDTITELINISTLQRIQNSFAKITGFAALMTDPDGNPITEESYYTPFCKECVQTSSIGQKRCRECHQSGARRALETGHTDACVCHAGLMVFSAPIRVGDRPLGCLRGGQVLTERPDRYAAEELSRELGIDFDGCWAALQRIPVVLPERLSFVSDFLYDMSCIVSDLADEVLNIRKESERVAGMKSDFLANMSHEIRTPMNSVIGMAELALREELPQTARDYIAEIRSSGNVLLNIINDILDFSKIESGVLDIQQEEYSPVAVFSEVGNIVIPRLMEKQVELILSINPALPKHLLGDTFRVRQILINLLSNAEKFTSHGCVRLAVDFDRLGQDGVCLRIAVKDTGLGIRREDMDTIFGTFQQLDSKRNRNTGGAGLGLAITKNLIELMGGAIEVESEFGKGSVFSFTLPQRVVDFEPCIKLEHRDGSMAIGYWSNPYLAEQFDRDLSLLGIPRAALGSLDEYASFCSAHRGDMEGKQILLFTEEARYEEEVADFARLHPELQVIVLTEAFGHKEDQAANVRYVRRPYSTLTVGAAIEQKEEALRPEDAAMEANFTAPDAKVLIVDDNEVNLEVAEGLLEPLKMQITKADSGHKAIQILEHERFDLVFMDHMMPELDGVETMKIIRRRYPELAGMPIIALSANAVEDARKMFLSEGMDDFVPKPIELRKIFAKVKKWLPQEKLRFHQAGEEEAEEAPQRIEIGDLDIDEALKLIGSPKLFFKILSSYYDGIEKRAGLIREYKEQEDIERFTIEVHSLKSSSKQIGALELSAMALELEMAGKENNVELIRQKTDALLERYLGYKEVLRPFVEQDEAAGSRGAASAEVLLPLFDALKEALDNLDMDGMESAVGEMKQYSYEGEAAELFVSLRTAVEEMDMDTCETVIAQWQRSL